MPEPLINIGVYNPFQSTAMIPRFGPPQSVSDPAEASPQPEESQEKPNPEQEQRQSSSVVDKLEFSREALEIRDLQMRDREVRAHEAAHAAAGGSYAGAPAYDYERGPDGRTYAVGGSVSIDISPIPGDPQATLQKAQQVRAAALAPAQPSAQDMKVAQQAQALAIEARGEISQEQIAERERQHNPDDNVQPASFVQQGMSAYARGIHDPGPARLETYS
ncbi:MAG TPA: putative metalloprotease CJM1_0395 family protein [Pelovirga sp.]|nr:putative metalloprotease CJM1_0395 family protein [Pelovirga sp.]